MSSTLPAAGMTTGEVARYLRVGEDRVRQWIRSGELGAINTAGARCGRPRWVVLPHHLQEWERSRRAAAPPRPARRRRLAVQRDFYPDAGPVPERLARTPVTDGGPA
jgi:excisionase family DNA binding protein